MAWTETRVQRVGAHLDVDAAGRALVALDVELRVLGGWLSRFELTGLGRELALDADKPPYLLSQDGKKRTPTIDTPGDGVLRFSFPARRRAPQRGLHRLHVLYRSQLPIDRAPDGGRSARWALPAWPIGLHDVRVSIAAPAGTIALPARGLSEQAAVRVQREERGALTFLRFERVHLPRTATWAPAFALPGPEPRGHHERRPPPGSQEAARSLRDQSSPARWFALAYLALLLIKLATLRSTGRALGLCPRFALSIPAGLGMRAVLVIAAGACALGAIELGLSPGWFLSALSCGLLLVLSPGYRSLPSVGPSATTAARDAVPHDLARARSQRLSRWLGPGGALDASSALGAALLLSLWSTVAVALGMGGDAERWLCGAILLSPLWITGTRAGAPITADRALSMLARLGPRLARRGLGVGLRLRQARAVVGARPSAAWLELSPSEPTDGLMSLQLHVITLRWLGRSHHAFALAARCEPESSADHTLSQLASPSPDPLSGAHRYAIATSEPVLDALALSARLTAQGTTAKPYPVDVHMPQATARSASSALL